MATCFISTLVLLLIFAKGEKGSESSCISYIKVPRNTLFTAPVMTVLKINCTVIKCQEYPKISWCKIDENDCKALNHSNNIETVWKNITQHDGISFLTFLNLSMEDAGLYRCEEGQTFISHSINVTVTEDLPSVPTVLSSTLQYTHVTIQNVDNSVGVWHYVNICRWSVGLIVILTGVSLIIRIKPKNDKKENKVMITKASDPSLLLPNADDSHCNISTQVSNSSDIIYVNIEQM